MKRWRPEDNLSRTYLPDSVRDRVMQLLRAETERIGTEVCAEVCGVSAHTLRKQMGGNYKQIRMPAADLIITGLFGPHLWHTDPVLREWYKA